MCASETPTIPPLPSLNMGCQLVGDFGAFSVPPIDTVTVPRAEWEYLKQLEAMVKAKDVGEWERANAENVKLREHNTSQNAKIERQRAVLRQLQQQCDGYCKESSGHYQQYIQPFWDWVHDTSNGSGLGRSICEAAKAENKSVVQVWREFVEKKPLETLWRKWKETPKYVDGCLSPKHIAATEALEAWQ